VPQFESPLENYKQINAMSKQPCWRLKSIVAQITLKLF
jgi:hypothetical protein